MNNITINNIFKYSIIIGLSIIPFLPLYVANPLFFPFITGKAFAFRIIVEIVFALWLILILREKGTAVVDTEKSVIPRFNYVTISITVFTLIALIADIFGLNPLRSIWSNFERMEGWLMIVHLWAYFIVLSSVLTTKENWKKFFDVVLIAGLIVALYGLFQFLGWADTHQGSRVDASLGNSAYMAIYMLINAFISAYMAISYFSRKNHLFWIYSIFAALFSFIMFQTATRGTAIGWTVAIIISCIIYAIFGRKNKGQTNKSRLISLGVVVAIFLIGILFYANKNAQFIQNNEVLRRLASISISDTKTQARGFIWPMAMKGIFENPKSSIIGIGQENFNYIFNANYNPKMYAHEQWFDRAHSVFLDWLVAGGLLGLLSYLLLYLISFIYIVKSDATIGQKSVLIGLIIGYGIHNIFVFDNQTSYIMFFTILSFVYSLGSNKKIFLFKNHDKKVSEDFIVVRDYVFVPIVVIGLASSLYFINIRPIQANTRLIDSLRSCSNLKTISTVSFKDALKLDQTISNQETREQLLNCSTSVIRDKGVPEQKKIEFYDFAKKEIENQIKETPNDARIYVIAGSYLNSIGDYQSATPIIEKALELSPNKQSVIYILALNYINIGKTKEAVALMEKAYLSAPENHDAKVQYIVSLIMNGEDSKAREMFSNDMKIFNDSKIVNTYVIKKQYAKAIEIYKEMIKESPDNQELYSSLAYAYLLNGQNNLALETLKKMTEKFPLLKSQIEELIKQIQSGAFKLQ